MIEHYLLLFAFLLFGHFLGDFPLQGDFVAKAKNHTKPLDGINPYYILFMHAFAQAMIVYVVTGSLIFMGIELVGHAVTDYLKNSNKISFAWDQAIHIGFKALYVLLSVFVFTGPGIH